MSSRTFDPENRLVARGLEAAWEKSLRELKSAETELARREQARPGPLTQLERTAVMSLGSDLNRVWSATELRTQCVDVNLAIVLDVFSRCIVGWAVENHLRTELVLKAIECAFAQPYPPAPDGCERPARRH